jgi:uncharacterized protein
MKQQAFQTNSLMESVTAFAQFLRSHGFNTGIQETQDALHAADANLFTNRLQFKYALKTIFCNSPEERLVFEKLFFLYWDTSPVDLAERKNKTTVQGLVNKKTNPSLVILGYGKNDNDGEDTKQVSGANETERLKKTDLTKLTEMDAGKLEELARRLCKQMAIRLRRRMKDNRGQGQINLRRTIRHSIAYGGEPLDLLRKSKTPKKQRLIVLLDVSGSMDKYSFFLLRFICALKENFRQLEAFVFSTSLKRISKSLQFNRLDFVLNAVSDMADNWSGGTRIGECLHNFNDQYGKRMLNGSPVVLILSDGLDTGDTDMLSKELQYIQRRAKKIIWLNPLKGMHGYEPTAKGMSAAMPSIHDFRAAHNLDSLLELENILADA